MRGARSLCLLAALTGCAEPRGAASSADAGAACEAYLAAYDACFDRLGPEARANGDRNLAGVREELIERGSSAELQARCRAASKQIDEACR